MTFRMKPLLLSLLALALAGGCNLQFRGPESAPAEQPVDMATEVPAPAMTPTLPPEPVDEPIRHVTFPSSSSLKPSTIHDHVCKDFAGQKRAYAGDEFVNGRLERPFTQDMEYLPFLDIVDATLAREKDFLYFTLAMVAPPEEFAGGPVMYGIEMDEDFDGRGDYLLLTFTPPGREWTQDGVQVWMDGDDSVGGVTPVRSDPPFGGGNGYETLVFDAGRAADPDLAWSRLDPDDDTRINLALKLSLFGGDQVFTWGAFVDGAIRDPGAFDLNDRFSIEDAGSALKESEYYPLKNFYAFDNTCRAASGYVSQGGEPGICPVFQPKIEEEAPGRNCRCTAWSGSSPTHVGSRVCLTWVCN